MHPTQHTTCTHFKRAADHSTHNPTVQQRRIAELLRSAAETLQAKGRAHARQPKFITTTHNGEAA